jgi:hypothetical protein
MIYMTDVYFVFGFIFHEHPFMLVHWPIYASTLENVKLMGILYISFSRIKKIFYASHFFLRNCFRRGGVAR